jgi:hypothetical protein
MRPEPQAGKEQQREMMASSVRAFFRVASCCQTLCAPFNDTPLGIKKSQQVVFSRLFKNIRMQGTRYPEE